MPSYNPFIINHLKSVSVFEGIPFLGMPLYNTLIINHL